MATAKDLQIAEDLIARSIDIFRFSAGERAKIFELLKRMEEDLVDLLLYSGRKLSDITRNDKTRLLQQAQAAIEQYYGQAATTMAASLAGLATVEAGALVSSMAEALHGAIVPSLPPEEFFRRLVDDTLIQKAPSAEWWNRQAGDVAFRFQNEVAYGLAQGETNDQIITRIRGRAVRVADVAGKRVYEYAGGVMQVARNNAAALVQTSVQTVANEARRATFDENSDIVSGIRQLSTLDSHTSPTCVAYSGAGWKLDASRTPIAPNRLPYNGGTPRHWNCRSVETPITKTFRELGINIDEPPVSTRASVDGQVAGNITFDEFLRRKPASFADDLLGPGRAQLWRDGKITLQQLLDGRGRELSLEELRKRYT